MVDMRRHPNEWPSRCPSLTWDPCWVNPWSSTTRTSPIGLLSIEPLFPGWAPGSMQTTTWILASPWMEKQRSCEVFPSLLCIKFPLSGSNLEREAEQDTPIVNLVSFWEWRGKRREKSAFPSFGLSAHSSILPHHLRAPLPLSLYGNCSFMEFAPPLVTVNKLQGNELILPLIFEGRRKLRLTMHRD